jgi:arylsulfatase A-like enzyme
MKSLCVFLLLIFSNFAWARSPNVVIFLSDDQGWGDLSVSGNQNLATPHIDSLAADGAKFDRFYVCPVCSPTRAEFLTGRFHQRGGVYSTSAGGERLDLDEVTIADSFRAAGYATGAFGKWHNGMQYPYHPNGRGFDEFYGFCSGHWGNYFSPMLDHNGEIVTGEGFLIDDLTDRGMAFMEEHRDAPFFLYLPYNTPHAPMQVPDEYWDRFKDKELAQRADKPDQEDIDFTRAALAMCENIDWNVGRVLEKLAELDLAEDTIVLYFSDNGPNAWRWNGGMKGRKGSVDEGGVRSPLVMRWPGKIKEGTTVEVLGGTIDLLPTLAELAGVTPLGSAPLDGVSLVPAILGQSDSPAYAALTKRPYFSAWNNKASVRTAQYRYGNDGLLFDMIADPGQTKDLATDLPKVVAELKPLLTDWSGEMKRELGEDTRPFLVGHPDSVITQVPARDGVPHGNIVRSCKHPNDSYFSNWISPDDEITWDVEVVADGEFEVRILHTCPESSVGTKLELSCGDARLTGAISEAHESPLLGADQDRVPRTESYTQHWESLILGTIGLKAGPARLRLRAPEIKAGTVMDFRLMLLRRL